MVGGWHGVTFNSFPHVVAWGLIMKENDETM